MWPIAVLNALMIIATLPEGGHHLIDVLAGAMVGVASIFAVRMIGAYERGRATASRDQRWDRKRAAESESSPYLITEKVRGTPLSA
ncbi:hypothetical protein EOB36_23690 [Mesorhizobium sp. M6A.T.Cr.TU.017.01.1.1]|nr:hypothetical protein EOB36_23690 [Mesorhizobium sp. M6A.T.Cr.TU.017.01.1.1]